MSVLFYLGLTIGLLGGLVVCDLVERWTNYRRWYKYKITFNNGEERTIISSNSHSITVDKPFTPKSG